jgi:DNA-binding transcriptional MerR regulator
MTPALSKTYTTKQVASLCSVSLRQLQWWDEAGLIHPGIKQGQRGGSGRYRIWMQEDIERVRIIRQLREKGVYFSHIASLLKRIDHSQPGYVLIEGTWEKRVCKVREKYFWRPKKTRYCPDEQQAIRLAASIDGPVLLIEIGGGR